MRVYYARVLLYDKMIHKTREQQGGVLKIEKWKYAIMEVRCMWGLPVFKAGDWKHGHVMIYINQRSSSSNQPARSGA